jgi:light-regulated signal transduction histidine kinase (bacteriophytochrome)
MLFRDYPEIEGEMLNIIAGGQQKRNSNYEINALTLPKVDDPFFDRFLFIIFNDAAIPVSDVSKSYHDIQEPIRSISNLLQILDLCIDKAHNSEAKKYITYALTSVKSLRELTTDLLARTITHRKDKTNIFIHQIMEEILALLQYQVSMRNCNIIIDTDMPAVYAIKSDVLIFFKNLVENSLKHSISNRDLVINVYEDCSEPNDDNVTVIFEDNGEDDLNRQIEQSTIIKGHGMGTEICYQIARSNGWSIKEELNCCNRFKYRITLPKAMQADT